MSTKRQSSESFNSVFLHVTLVLPYGKKMFLTWTERSDAKRWLIKYAWLFQSIGGLHQLVCIPLQTNVAKNTSSIPDLITERDIESQMLYISQQSCLLHYGDHYIPCFLLVPPCIGLRWFLDAVIIFLTYLSIHISTAKHPKQNKWFDK